MEKIKVVFEDKKVRIEEILSRGEASPQGFWFDQSDCEFVYLADGFASLEFSDGLKLSLHKGESFFIEKHIKHRVSQTSQDCKWICVFEKENEI